MSPYPTKAISSVKNTDATTSVIWTVDAYISSRQYIKDICFMAHK